MNPRLLPFVFSLTVVPMVFSGCKESTGNFNTEDDVGEVCTKSPSVVVDEVRILLIGKTGVGKSTTGNTILGFKAFDTKVSATSVTAETQYNETTRFGKRLVVVDTPGLFDTNRTEEEIAVEMMKWYTLVSPGIHAIVLVVPVGRFTEEEQKTVDFFMKVFGKDLKDYLVVVFTHKDRLEHEGMTVDDFLQTMDKNSNLRKLIDEIKGRYTAIGYYGKEEDRVKEVKDILSMIDGIKGYYSNDVFKKVQEQLEEIERKRKEELEPKEKMYSESEVNTILDLAMRSETRTNIVNNNIQEDVFTKLITTIGNGVLALGSIAATAVVTVASGLGSAAGAIVSFGGRLTGWLYG